MNVPVTPRDELYALLSDYEREGACSCAESALLRWANGRLLVNAPGDEALAREAVRRMAVIDSGRHERARTPEMLLQFRPRP